MNLTFKFLLLATALLTCLAGCKLDNLDKPESTLSGNITYNGKALGVRSTGGFQLELWQRGYAVFTKIPVYIDQNGHFSTRVFDGQYKLVRLAGTFPWADQRDSIDVKVSGTTSVDVPLSPYFILSNVSVAKSGTSITATVTVTQTTAGKTLDQVKLYLGATTIVDELNNAGSANKTAATITLGQPATITLAIPASLASRAYLFARVGVKTTGVTELVYDAPVELSLK